MSMDSFGAVQAFQGGLNAGNQLIDSNRRRELHDTNMQTAQLNLDKSRAEFDEYQQTAGFRSDMRDRNLSLVDQKLRQAGLAEDAQRFNTFLQSASNFKKGDVIPPEVVASANRLGVNMNALTGARYQRNRAAFEGLMNGEYSRNDPEVLQVVNDLAVPMINNRPGQDKNLTLVAVKRLDPDADGNLMIQGTWRNKTTGETYDAPITANGSKDGTAPVRAFRVRDLMGWMGSMDSIAGAVNGNPDLAKAVLEARSQFFPTTSYSGIKYQPGLGHYQTDNTNKVITLGKGTGKGSGLYGGGMKNSDFLQRDKEIRAGLLKLLPEGTDEKTLAAMMATAQNYDRRTGGLRGTGELASMVVQLTDGVALTQERALQQAQQEAKAQLEKDGDVFDNFFGMKSDDNEKAWIQKRASELLQNSPDQVRSRLAALDTLGRDDIQQLAPGFNVSDEDADAILAEAEELLRNPGGMTAASKTSAVPQKASSQKPADIASAISQLAAENPSLSDAEVEAQAVKQWPDLFIGGGQDSGTGLKKVAHSGDSDLSSYFDVKVSSTNSGRGIPKASPVNKELQTELLQGIDEAAGKAKAEKDRSRYGRGMVTQKAKDAHQLFNDLKEYRKQIKSRNKPDAELARRVAPYLNGRAKQQAEMLAGTEV